MQRGNTGTSKQLSDDLKMQIIHKHKSGEGYKKLSMLTEEYWKEVEGSWHCGFEENVWQTKENKQGENKQWSADLARTRKPAPPKNSGKILLLTVSW